MWSRLINIVEECWLTVWRTAFSLIIGEAQDFACELLDPRGNSLAHSPRAMPVFNLTLPRAVRAILARFPAETLAPGDVLITNDPWICAGHLFDVAIVTPVFRDGRVVAILGTIGHVTDIGGTRDSLSAREIYEEGFQIPPMKLYRAGAPNEDLFRLLAENVRKSEQVLGDLHALISANASGRPAAPGLHGGVRAGGPRSPGHGDPGPLGARDARGHPRGCRTARIEARSGTTAWARRSAIRVTVTVQGDAIDDRLRRARRLSSRAAARTAPSATRPLTPCTRSSASCRPAVPSNAGCYRPFSVTAPRAAS